MAYDRALTVFSPDGHLFQVEYAMEAVARGTAVVGVCGTDGIVLVMEKSAVPRLQIPNAFQKVALVDENIIISFAGMAADGRVLINLSREICQMHRLKSDEAASAEYLARSVASIQQSFTQKGGARPFGASLIIGGINEGIPSLFLTDPAGSHSEWRAAAIGQNSDIIREFLEKHYTEKLSKDGAIRMAIRALLEVAHTGSKNIVASILRSDLVVEELSPESIGKVVASLEAEINASNAI